MNHGLYIHIPFCRKKCPYCDFYSQQYTRALAEEYINILAGQIRKIDVKVTTVYIGGGTPTVLDPDLIDVLLKSLGPVLRKSKESTIEANPESLSKEKCSLFLKRGINRISIGAQSLRDEKLSFLGRIHSSDQAQKAIDLAVSSGFKNISADFIYGLPGETVEEWKKEIERIAELPLQHLSCYSLTCEQKTPFYIYRKKIDQDRAAEMYERNMSFLPRHGFIQYEISNYSRRGYACLHNGIYWENGPYLGLGASAFSYIRGRRSQNIPDVRQYIRRLKRGEGAQVFEEILNPEARARETAAMNIRRRKGILFREFLDRTGFEFKDIVDEKDLAPFFARKILCYRTRAGKRIGLALTDKGFLLADEVCSTLV